MAKGLESPFGYSEFFCPGSPPSAPTRLSKGLGVFKSVFGFVLLKEHLGLFEKSRGLSPVPVFYLSSFHRHHFIPVN